MNQRQLKKFLRKKIRCIGTANKHNVLTTAFKERVVFSNTTKKCIHLVKDACHHPQAGDCNMCVWWVCPYGRRIIERITQDESTQDKEVSQKSTL